MFEHAHHQPAWRPDNQPTPLLRQALAKRGLEIAVDEAALRAVALGVGVPEHRLRWLKLRMGLREEFEKGWQVQGQAVPIPQEREIGPERVEDQPRPRGFVEDTLQFVQELSVGIGGAADLRPGGVVSAQQLVADGLQRAGREFSDHRALADCSIALHVPRMAGMLVRNMVVQETPAAVDPSLPPVFIIEERSRV